MDQQQIIHDLAVVLAAKKSDATAKNLVDCYYESVEEITAAMRGYRAQHPRTARFGPKVGGL